MGLLREFALSANANRLLMDSTLRVLILLIFVTALSVPRAGHASPKAQVLVINSYHHGFKWTDDIVAGITSSLKNNAELRIEYMDARRIFSKEYLEKLRETYLVKFRGQHYDAIIVSDDPALDLLLVLRGELFPGVPVIFCGINDFSEARLRGEPLFTGVIEETDLNSTLEIARKLHPKLRKVIALVNSNATGIANRRLLEKSLPNYKGLLDIEIVQDPELALFMKRLGKLPQSEHMILLTGRFTDATGREIPPNESTPQLAASGIPLYSLWEFYLGHGIVGGKLTNGFYQGVTAAAITRRVLAGEKDVPIVKESPNEYVFDFKELRHHNIDQSLLPTGSRIVNRPESFYERHSKAIWVALTLTLSYTSIILLLWRNIQHKKQAERELVAHKENLEKQVEERTHDLQNLLQEEQAILETLPTGLCILRNRIIERCNPAMEAMFGFPTGTLAGRSARCLFKDEQTFIEYGKWMYDVMQDKGQFEGEIPYLRSNGEYFWALDRGIGIFKERAQEYAIFSITDITEQKRQQEELNLRNKELEETLARVKKLEGIISICMYCKRIRNEQAAWDQLEKYITEHTDALFSHGVCPECKEIYMPGVKTT
jgi:PAS domain S-box-containing protein